MDAPRNGWATSAKLVRILDGDTIEVEVSRRFELRLSHSKQGSLLFNTASKKLPEGKSAIEFLHKFFEKYPEFVVFIPAKENLDLTDVGSFNRLVGEVWIPSTDNGPPWLEQELTQQMLNANVASLVKKVPKE